MCVRKGIRGRKRGPTPHAKTPRRLARPVENVIRTSENHLYWVSAKNLGYGHPLSPSNEAWGEAIFHVCVAKSPTQLLKTPKREIFLLRPVEK